MRAWLRRSARVVLLCTATGVGATGCEDPIIVIGDLPGIMRRVAGVPNSIGTAVDSAGTRTQLHTPRGLAIGADGTLYIADSGNRRIVAVGPAGRVSVLASGDSCIESCLVEPHGLAVAQDGALWIADRGAHRIFRLTPDTRILEPRAGTGAQGDSPDGTPPLEADLNGPAGIAIGAGGIVYFSEHGGHRVRWIHAQAGLQTIAGTGEAGYSDGSPATNAQLHGPLGLSIHGPTLFVADERNNRVRAISLVGGGIRTVAGNGVAGFSETDTLAATAKLNRPRGITVTSDGTQLFIADAVNHLVRVVNLGTGRIARFAGTGQPDFSGEGLDAADTSLSEPADVAAHANGVLFIADTGHQIVWRTPLRF